MIRFRKIFPLLLAFIFISSPVLFAATRTWTGAGADNLASTALNWSGSASPVTGDDVVFDGAFPVTGVKDCTWDLTSSVNANSFNVQSGYTGVLSITTGKRIRVANTFTFNGGTLDVNGAESGIAIYATTFDASGAGSKTINAGASGEIWQLGGIDISGTSLTFNKETSFIYFGYLSSSANIKSKSGNDFYDLGFYSSTITRSYTISSDITVSHTFYSNYAGNSEVNLNALSGGPYYIHITGDYNTVGTGEFKGDTILKFDGSGSQVWYGGNRVYVSIEIAVTGSLSLNNGLSKIGKYGGNLTHTSGTVSEGTSTCTLNTGVSTGVTVTTNGMNFYNLELIGGTHVLNNNITVKGYLDVQYISNAATTINGYKILVEGDIKKTGSTSQNVTGTTIIEASGGNNQSINLTAGTGYVGLGISFNKSANTATFAAGTTRVSGNTITHVAGVVDTSTNSSTLEIKGSVTLDTGSGMIWYNFSINIAGAATVYFNSDLYVSGTLELEANSSNITLSTSYGAKIYASGHVYRTGSSGYTYSTTVTLEFTGTSAQNFGNFGANGSMAMPVIINKSSNTLTLVGTLYFTGGMNISYTLGSVSAGTSKVVLYTASGNVIDFGNNFHFYKLSINSANITDFNGNDVYVDNDMDFCSVTVGVKKLDNGTIHIQGNSYFTAVGANYYRGTADIIIDGNAVQTFDYSNNNGAGYIGQNFEIDKTAGGSLTAAAGVHHFSVYNPASFVYSGGVVDLITNSATIKLSGNKNLDADGLDFYNLQISTGTTTLISNASVKHTLTIDSSSFLSAGAYSLSLSGDFLNSGSFTYGTSTVILDGTTQQDITGNLTFYNLKIKAGAIVDFSNTASYNIAASGFFQANGTPDSSIDISSDSAGFQFDFTVSDTATLDVDYASATDVDSSAGQTVKGTNLTLGNATNWQNSSLANTIAYAF